MKIVFLSFILILNGLGNLHAQNITPNDTIRTIGLEEITITASKTDRSLFETAAKVEIINSLRIEKIPSQKIDDILRFSSGVDVSRATGNYSMRPTVTLRGMGGDEQGRTLILINGIPINTSDEGGVNWNRINTNTIQKIEICKGSGSSLYGNNAMGGVINIITRKPLKAFECVIGTSYGTFNTYKPELYFGGTVNKKITWSLSGFYQQSEGYNNIPESKPEHTYSVARFLKEGGLSATIGYKINELIQFDFRCDIYRDKRGEGEKIKAPDGEYRNFNTNSSNINVFGKKEKFGYQLNLYFQREQYFRIDERMKGANYTRFDVRSNRDDYGLLLHSNYTYAKRHVVSMGLEYKMGSVKGGDYYQTSSDVVLNSGSQTFMALYIQNELQLLSDKLNITTGIRLDNVKFQDGLFQAKGSNVDYWTAYSPKLTDHSWNAISPKASIQYSLLTNLSAYASWSKGFRASILDDLCRSGWMWVGPKVANPELGPEYINNYESGLKFVLFKKLILEPGIYFLDGKDFLYYVANGDTLSNRPVYRRENISKVSCKGIEIDVRFNVNPKISFWTNYTYNTSKILEFIKNPELEGKYLKYTPKHKASLGCIWLNKYIDTGLGFMYKDKQYSNDMNSAEIEDYFTIDFQLSRSFYHSRLTTSLNIQDLFNNRHMETSDYLSPGRLVTFKIQYKL